jgi:hypothetical protein
LDGLPSLIIAINHLISHVLGIVSQIGIFKMEGGCLSFRFLPEIGQLFSKGVSQLRASVASLWLCLYWMDGHDSKTALIEHHLFLHLLLDGFGVVLIDILMLNLFFLLRMMAEVLLLIFQRFFPN